MTGRRFIRVLKDDLAARHDFEALLLEQRTEIHKQLESATPPEELYRLQGKIRCLDDLAMRLEALSLPQEDDEPA